MSIILTSEYSLGHLVSHRRTHTGENEGTEAPTESEDCGDPVKCEKEPVERKPEIR